MSKTITRRSFLAGSAGAVGAAALSGFVGFHSWQHAYAVNYEKDDGVQQLHTLCDGCGNQCGMNVWIKDNYPLRVMGMKSHPNSLGKMCGRGQGLVTLPFSEDRLTEPLKKDDSGKFSQISWDQAFEEIAQKFNDDPTKVAAIQARGTDSWFVKRFMTAIGSPNYYSDAAFNDCDITAAVETISGAYPSPDTGNAKYILMVDKSYYDGFRPSEAIEYAQLKEKGDAKVVDLDPRLTSFSSMIDEWLPCRPGTELAFLLAVANQLLQRGTYAKDFISQYGNGFSDFKNEMSKYSLSWASDKTGIPADKIGEVAASLWTNAPASLVDMSWAGAFGCGYANSVDTVRMLLLLNVMLGNTNQTGGMTYGKAPYVADAMLDSSVIKPLDALKSYPVGAMDAMLSWGSSAVGAINGMISGDITSAILFETNPVQDFTDADKVKQALGNLDCLVVCDMMMTDTAQMADYVLPLTSYLERTDTINTVYAKTSVATMRHPVIDKIHPDTKTIDEIVSGLAEQCGKGDYFNFSIDDYNGQVAKLMGVSYDGLKEQAVAEIPKATVTAGSAPYYRTKSKKIDFSSSAFTAAGRSAVPTWTDPESEASEDHPRLLVGEQNIHTHTYTSNSARLMDVSKTYNLQRLWINSDFAQSLGVSENDTVEVSSDAGSFKTKVHVTNCIHPEAVWMASHYGCTSKDEKTAYNFGSAVKSIVPLASETGTGAAMVQEAVVSVKKVGA